MSLTRKGKNQLFSAKVTKAQSKAANLSTHRCRIDLGCWKDRKDRFLMLENPWRVYILAI